MFDNLLDKLKSPWLLLGAALIATKGGRKLMRGASKEAIRGYLTVSDRVKDLVAEVREEASDVVAEVQAEIKEQQGKHHTEKHKEKEKAST